MLRIHFSLVDLARTQAVSRPDPLWETVFSLQMLRARYAQPVFGPWRRQVRERLHQAGLARGVRGLLFPLTPDEAYFPDFLTPLEGMLGLRHGLAQLRGTPKPRLRRELGRVFGDAPPPWAVRLAGQDRELHDDLAGTIRRYFDVVLTPQWERMRTAAEVRHAQLRTRDRIGGVPGQLSAISPLARWHMPVLEVPYPVERDLVLGGRGILLIPSVFLWHHPVTLAAPELPPVLVYPIRPGRDFLTGDLSEPSAAGLRQLIGSTRERMLRVIGTGAGTLELAGRCGVSAATASRHVAILRDAGFITSHRSGASVLHTLTALGRSVLDPSTLAA